MAKKTTQYACQSCGAVYPKWAGKCEACGSWNTIQEEAIQSATMPKNTTGGVGGHRIEFVSLDGVSANTLRLKSGISELDRVCGGGLVAGSVILIGGDPGIGKSTLLLQASSALSQAKTPSGKPVRCIYISGEESVDQVRLRASRLGLNHANVELASAQNVRDIVASLDVSENIPDVVVIDSIQTMFVDTLDASPGTVSQVKASGFELISLAKKRGFALFLVGHVTKDGSLAGPRVLEHAVDAVLYFEGDRGHHFRILRSVKNRFGATDEIGVFEMNEQGLAEVPNPSALFLAQRCGNVSGNCVFAGIEGSRPLLVEIQVLIAENPGGNPRRQVVGWDNNRLNMLLAVLETRCGIRGFSMKDVYLNVAGGMRLTEPAVDLAVAASLLSACTGIPVPADAVIFGEVGLSGEVRGVPQPDLRLKEATKMGFKRVLMPPHRNINKKSVNLTDNAIKEVEVGNLKTLASIFGINNK
ncbi:MAG: DNA repair protein RadA [Alphaproteobacteria bacterium]|nr:DNA repair protein RadA [Alphaproteobacteria bacterium]